MVAGACAVGRRRVPPVVAEADGALDEAPPFDGPLVRVGLPAVAGAATVGGEAGWRILDRLKADLSTRHRAMLDFAVALTETPWLVEEADREELRRTDVVVQSVDIGRLRADGRGAGEEILLLMARDTGGELFSNYNDLGAAMAQLAARTAVSYLLSVRVDVAPGDRRFQRLDVRLRNGPRGADVRHRVGYYPPALAGQ